MRGGLGGRVVKRDVKTNVTLVDADSTSVGAERVCVKEFVRAGAKCLLPRGIRHRPAIHSWRAASRSEALGIGTPEILGLVIGRGASSYLIMRAADRFEALDSYVRGAFAREQEVLRKGAFLRAAADFLQKCYTARVFHGDLKSSNIFVRETKGGWEFSLLDLAAVRFPRRIRPADKFLNLAQLNASTPLEITWADRMRFLRRLAEQEPDLAGRRAIAEIARLTRSRRRVWAI